VEENHLPVGARRGGWRGDICDWSLAAFLEKGGAVERVYGTHVSVIDAVWQLAADVESGIASHASHQKRVRRTE
jgi:hypothetical protein